MKDDQFIGAYWQPYINRIGAKLKSADLSDFRADPILCKGFGDASTLNPVDLLPGWKRVIGRALGITGVYKWHLRLIHTYYLRWLKEKADSYSSKYREDVLSLPENTTLFGCRERFDVDGREYAFIYVDQLQRIKKVEQRIDLSGIQSMLEIGPGFGVNIHLLAHRYPNIKTMYIVDLAPILRIAAYYLAEVGVSVTSLTPEGIREIPDVDLVWNACSFQEMPRDTILYYLEHIARMHPKHVVLFGIEKSRLDGFPYKAEACSLLGDAVYVGE